MKSEGAPNVYSRRWFEFFHVGIHEARTNRETEFICRCAPLLEFQHVLDVCCGMGRHARELASRGYSVTGIDRDTEAIAAAREAGGGPKYEIVDVRDYQPKPEAFDAAIIMGQSFGHFDATTNRGVLGRLSGAVRTRGRLILDLWQSGIFYGASGRARIRVDTRSCPRKEARLWRPAICPPRLSRRRPRTIRVAVVRAARNGAIGQLGRFSAARLV
jgi:SAM-dependent methyltransferase